jgi:hypothetical protein
MRCVCVCERCLLIRNQVSSTSSRVTNRYWLGAVDGLSSLHHYIHLIGLGLPALMTAHTSVTLLVFRTCHVRHAPDELSLHPNYWVVCASLSLSLSLSLSVCVHTWVRMCMHVAQLIMDMSALHTDDLRLASCRCISLHVLENAVLFIYRIAEFSARVCVCSYAWYGMDCQHCASSDCTCWFRYVRAKSFACKDIKGREMPATRLLVLISWVGGC